MDSAGVFGRDAGQRPGAFLDAQLAQPAPLGGGAEHPAPARERDRHQRGEIDMGREISFAGGGEGIDLAVIAHGLKAGAKARFVVAIVEEQRRAG